MIYRRFGFLHSRLLLWKQDELREIEQILERLDWEDANGSHHAKLCLRSREDDAMRTDRVGKEQRSDLLRKGEQLIKEYGKNFKTYLNYPHCNISGGCYRTNHRVPILFFPVAFHWIFVLSFSLCTLVTLGLVF